MKKIIIVILVGLSTGLLAQQGVNNLWFMGYKQSNTPPYYGGYHLDFNSGTMNVANDYLELFLSRTHTNISDTNGNMLFYTNGYDICDASDSIMQNGDTIGPSKYRNSDPYGLPIPQACLTIPFPGQAGKYLLFHSTIDSGYGYAFYFYNTEIDMTLNNGLGAVTTNKNVKLISDSLNLGKITSCKHGNGRDWWVVCMQSASDTIYKFLVTPYSIDGPFKQAIGTKRLPCYGEIKFSPDGNKFAFFNADYTADGKLEVFDFDRCNGMFSNPLFIPVAESTSFGGGVDFSPNSQLLYVANADSIYQYDMQSSNVGNSKIIVAANDGFIDTIASLGLGVGFLNTQLAPDGKIYITSGNSTHYMSVIDQPDSPGLACNVMQHAVQLPALYFNTLPNHPNYFLGANGLCNNLGLPIPSKGGAKKIQVFGNPTHDKFTLWFPVDKDVGVLEIYDVNGECIRTERVSQWSQYKTVDIGALSEWVYFVKMSWPDGEGSVKVVRLE
nr:T9SS type A sorting domain-containing protein [Bacteroidota bacterium]